MNSGRLSASAAIAEIAAAVAWLAGALPLAAAEQSLNGHTFTLPDDWEISLAAPASLTPRPIEADFDLSGALYVTNSSGSNDPVDVQVKTRPHSVLRLKDADGDGVFESRTVFADQLMFPEGVLWHDGSLYVAAPPQIWKLTDADGDGVAERREVWHDGKTLTGCANDLHGPYRGPDGWIYWCKGAFASQNQKLPDGTTMDSRASHLLRARPDGSGREVVMTGGMDNPVGLTWTREGEPILSCTFLVHPGGGKRDGLLHAVTGGVWGKDHDVLAGHLRTGPLMPVMTHMGPAAPCGLTRLADDSLLCCQFNMRKVSRHVLTTSAGPMQTQDSDFLTSNQPDFHPTDVLECRDGSVLVLDTGGWYKLCCPTSQIAKPDVLGAIYRLRRRGAVAPAAFTGPDGVWTAFRAGLGATVRTFLTSLDPSTRHAAALAAGRARDSAATGFLTRMLEDPDPGVVRAAVEALGRIGTAETGAALMRSAMGREEPDRFLDHAFRYAIFSKAIADFQSAVVAAARSVVRPGTAYGVVLRAEALDRLPGGNFTAAEFAAAMKSAPPAAVPALAEMLQRHPDWVEPLLGELRDRLSESGIRDETNRQLFRAAAAHSAAQSLLAEALAAEGPRRTAVLEIMAGAPLAGGPLPGVWDGPLLTVLESGQPDDKRRAAAVLAAHPPSNPDTFAQALEKWSAQVADADFLSALQILRRKNLSDSEFARLKLIAGGNGGVESRVRAAQWIAGASLTDAQRREVPELFAGAGPLELAPLLRAATASRDGNLVRAALEKLQAGGQWKALAPAVVQECFQNAPEDVRNSLAALIAGASAGNSAPKQVLEEFAASLPRGDKSRGHLVFQSAKAQCTMCHQIGYKGGALGPDLSRIGGIRTERDLLEAILFPSASFVRSYEPMRVEEAGGAEHLGILRQQGAEGVTLLNVAMQEISIPAAKIISMRPAEVSLMPAGFDKILTKEEVADLVVFLKSLQ